MLPELFSCMPFAKKPRFAGDPWATQPHSPTWHWMHTTECGSPNQIGKCTSLPVDRQPWPEIDWVYMPAPPRAMPKAPAATPVAPAVAQRELFAGAV